LSAERNYLFAAGFLAGAFFATFLAGAFFAVAFLAGAFFTGISYPPFHSAVAEDKSSLQIA